MEGARIRNPSSSAVHGRKGSCARCSVGPWLATPVRSLLGPRPCDQAVRARFSPPTPTVPFTMIRDVEGRMRAHRPRSRRRGRYLAARRSVAVAVRSECSSSVPRHQRHTSASPFRYQPLSFSRLDDSRAPTDKVRRAAACACPIVKSAKPWTGSRSPEVKNPRYQGTAIVTKM